MNTSRTVLSCAILRIASRQHSSAQRLLHQTHKLQIVKPFLLADIGEGITECQLIQWFVQPGARVEQFDRICEVQSDKASVEITSPFDGVIKKLHYETDDMAKTGSALVDIDIQGEIDTDERSRPAEQNVDDDTPKEVPSQYRRSGFELATPAVRHMVKELNVKLGDVKGSGKDGRVLREDVQRHMKQHDDLSSKGASATATRDQEVQLTPVQHQMFKTMTRSLSIPHFLYTCSIDMTQVTDLRNRLALAGSKITSFAFILKAVSLAFAEHEILNASLDTSTNKPVLTYYAAHNFGVAIDTPSGLLVPVIRNVQTLSIRDIALQLRSLSDRAHSDTLSPTDFSGATFTLSNIGSIGGGVVSPVISAPQVAILGIGRSKIVPAFDNDGKLYRKEELVMSWSADHRVVDGAQCARCAERARTLLEEPGSMLTLLR